MSYIKNRIKRILPKGRFQRSVALMAGGSFLSLAILAVATPITTRLYTPADYGVLAVYTGAVNLLCIVASGRYELSIPLPENKYAAANLLVLSLAITVFFSAIVALGIFFGAGALLSRFNAAAMAPYLWLLPVSMIAIGGYQALSYWAVRNKKFGDLARTKLNQSLGANAVVLGLGVMRAGPIGLLLGLLVSHSAGIGTLIKPLLAEGRDYLSNIKLSEMRRLMVVYRKFPLLSAPSSLFNSAACSLPPILLASFYNREVAGLFGLAMKIVGVPGMLLCKAVSQAYLGEIAESVRECRGDVATIFSSVTKKLMKASLLVIAFGCISPYIFGFVFGKSWQQAGLYSAFLSIFAAAELVVSPISTVVIVFERQDLQMLGDVTRCILVVLAIYVPHRLGMSAEVAVACYSAIMVITYIGYYLIYRWVASNAKTGKCISPNSASE